MKKYILLLVSALFLVACDDGENVNSNVEVEEEVAVNEQSNSENKEESEGTEESDQVELTESEKTIAIIIDLIDEGLAFDTGDYVKGDIPKGEYVFVKFEGSGSYYSEVDGAGNIVDNENFDSFGYVQVHESGDIETGGVLIDIESIDRLGVSGARELFEVLNDVEEYDESGYYKVGFDIDPGEYSIESYGSGYIGVMSGPVGNSEIIENDNFSGSYTVTIKDGQYLTLSKAYISE